MNLAVMRSFGIATGSYFTSFLPQWCVALAAAVLTMALLRFAPETLPPVGEIAAASLAYGAIFCLLAKMLLDADLKQLVRVAPRPMAGVIERVFRLPRLEN